MAVVSPSSPSRPQTESLIAFTAGLRARLWRQRALRIALRTLAGTAGMLLAARFAAAIGAAGAADALLLLAGMLTVGGAIAAVRSRPTAFAAARAADRSLQLQERLATALELASRPQRSELATRQVEDATSRVAGRRPAEAFSPLLSRRDLVITSVSLALAAGAWFTLPDLSSLLRSPFGWSAAEAEAAATPLGNLNDNNVNDILSSIEETRRRAQERQIDPAEAQRQLNEAQSRLNARIEASNRQQQNLQRLADQLRQTSTAQDVAGAIDRGEYSLASDLLNELARESDQLSPQARRELAQALERAAQQTEQNPGLRDAQRRAAQALNRGDYQEIDRSMRNLGDQVTMAGREVTLQSEFGRAQSRLDQARQELGGGQDQTGAGDQGFDGRGGQQGAGGQQAGSSASGSQPGNMPGQNRPGPGGQEARPGQQAPQQQALGNQRPGELPQQDNPGSDRLGVGGRPLQIDAQDSGGQLRPSDGQGEQRGSLLTNVRPAAGVGVAQPTDPVQSLPDFTQIAPERRPSIRTYFTPNNR